MAPSPSLERFLEAVTASSGRPALSEAKSLRLLAGAPEVVTIAETDGGIAAVGVAAAHPQPDGTDHWAIETAVRPDLAFAEFEETVLQRMLDVVPSPRPSVWSSRSSLDTALDRLGFREVRRLLHMVVDLPLEVDRVDAIIRPFDDGDLDGLLAVNRAAFCDHREAAGLDHDTFDDLRRQPWFDPAGLLVVDAGSEVFGFCWTKVHPDGDGEIYRIAVDPRRHGEGWGRRLVTAGFVHLSGEPGVRRGTLWVDATNPAAISLYESLGMAVAAANAEFERQPKR